MKQFVHSSYPVGIGMYKYLSGYHHWVRGNESQARAKWKFGVSHGDKHGMKLWSTLCQQQLLRTANNKGVKLHTNIAAYDTVGKRLNTLGFPQLQYVFEFFQYTTANKHVWSHSLRCIDHFLSSSSFRQAVNDEIASFELHGMEWKKLQQEVVTLDR